jgi:Ca2+/Na+ antiporter
VSADERSARARYLEFALAYVLAHVFALLAALVPASDGPAGYELALPVLCFVALSAAWPIFGVAFVVTTFAFNDIRLYVGSLELPITDIGALGLLVGQLLKLFTIDPPVERLRPLKVYLLFIAAAAFSAIYVGGAGPKLYYVARHYAFYAIAYLYGVMPAIRATCNSTLKGLLLPLVPMILLSICFSLYRIDVHHDLWAKSSYDAGPYGSVQEVLPATVILFWPFVRLLRQETTTASNRQAMLILEVALLVAVAIGFVKTAWLMGLIIVGATMLIERGSQLAHAKLRRRLIALLVAAPIVVGLLAVGLTILNAGSSLPRAVQWVASLEYWSYRPVWGNGPGTAATFQFQSVAGYLLRHGHAMSATEPHGFVIKLLPEVGAVGLLLYCAFLVSVFAMAIRALDGASLRIYQRATACFATLVSLVAYLFVTPDTFSSRAWFVFALVIAVLTSESWKRQARRVFEPSGVAIDGEPTPSRNYAR